MNRMLNFSPAVCPDERKIDTQGKEDVRIWMAGKFRIARKRFILRKEDLKSNNRI